MQSTRLAKGDLTERYRQLAGEVVVQMISDIKLLNRRKVLSGLITIAKPKRNAGYGDGYKSYIESDELVRAVRGEPMETWLISALFLSRIVGSVKHADNTAHSASLSRGGP